MVRALNTAHAPLSRVQERLRAAVELAIGGALRYLSHHDELRMLTRALVRAGWPLAYSQGFNPKPRLTLPLPRNVGVSADQQLALVGLCEHVDTRRLEQQLATHLPDGCALQRVLAPFARRVPHPREAVYEVELEPADAGGLAGRIAGVLEAPALLIDRERGPGKPVQPLDIRPYINGIELNQGLLRMRLGFVQQRTARPAEITKVLGLAAERYNHRLRRAEVQWDMEIAPVANDQAVHERNEFGNQQEDNQEEDQGRR